MTTTTDPRTAECEHCAETVTYAYNGNWTSLDGDPICYDGDSGPVWHTPKSA